MEQNQEKFKKENEISGIGITKDRLTGRGGFSFISRYLRNIGIVPMISSVFTDIRKSGKGRNSGFFGQPNTIRGLFIDIAGKIVRSGRKIILKFEAGIFNTLKLNDLRLKFVETVSMKC